MDQKGIFNHQLAFKIDSSLKSCNAPLKVCPFQFIQPLLSLPASVLVFEFTTKYIIMCLQWKFLKFWKISYSRWDFILDWTLSGRMACTCLLGRIWTVPYFLVIDSWNPPPVGYPTLIIFPC